MCVVRKEEGKEEAINRRGVRCPVEEVFFLPSEGPGQKRVRCEKSPSMGLHVIWVVTELGRFCWSSSATQSAQKGGAFEKHQDAWILETVGTGGI
jgi:hypothetical protein